MHAKVIKKNANDPTAAAMPAQKPASQPHSTTQDQINTMESEGQATKPGQDAQTSKTKSG